MTDVSPDILYGYNPEEWQEAIKEKLFHGRAAREAKRILLEEEFPSQPIPRAWSGVELLAAPRPEARWRIEGWQLVESKALLVAQAKSGKTVLTHNVLRSILDGDKFLRHAKATVLDHKATVLDFEMNSATAAEWIEQQEIKNLDKLNYIAMRGAASSFNILDPKTRQNWVHLLAELDTEYLIVDCLRPILDALGLDEHRDAGKFFIALEALCAGAGVTEMLVVHHMGHGGERSRGDSRILDWPDAIWNYTREDPNDQSSVRFIRASGRDVELPEQKVLMDTRKRLTYAKGGRKDKGALQALDGVCSVLMEHGVAASQRTVLTLLKQTEFSRRDILKALEIGVFRGQIVTETGPHKSTLYAMPSSWTRTRLAGGEGD